MIGDKIDRGSNTRIVLSTGGYGYGVWIDYKGIVTAVNHEAWTLGINKGICVGLGNPRYTASFDVTFITGDYTIRDLLWNCS